MQHRLTNIDTETKVATCAVCGPTPIGYRRDRKQWRCKRAATLSTKNAPSYQDSTRNSTRNSLAYYYKNKEDILEKRRVKYLENTTFREGIKAQSQKLRQRQRNEHVNKPIGACQQL